MKVVWAHEEPCRSPTYDEVLREILRPGDSIHWSRIFEWPWAVLSAELAPTDVVLEAGGGSSPLQYLLARRAKRVVNLDDDQASLDEAEVLARDLGVNNIIHRRGDLRSIAYTDGAFDKIVCVSVLEHIEDTAACLTELWRVLRPGGRLLLTLDVADRARWNHTLDLAGAAALLAHFGIALPPLPPDALQATFAEIDPQPDEPTHVALRVLCAQIDKPLVSSTAASTAAAAPQPDRLLQAVAYPSLHLDLFAYCNAACTFCRYPTMERHGQMSWNLLRKIVAELQTWGEPAELALMHYGEFFLRPDWRVVLAYLAQEIPHFPLVLSTNGSMFDKEGVLEAVIACSSLRYLNFSAYADTPEEYRRVMGLDPRTLEVIQRAVERLRRERPDLALEVGMTTDTNFVPAAELVRVKRRWADKGVILGVHEITTYAAAKPITSACGNIFSSMVVLHDGRVAACCHDAEGDLLFGDAMAEPLLDIWRGAEATRIRALHNSGERPSIALCRGCTHAPTGITTLARQKKLDGLIADG